MGGGHYTATIKNERTQEWLYYDDSSVRSYAESDVVSRSAYILFYRRKDLAQKPMSLVVPRLNKTFFTGMPIRTKQGWDCYLIEYREGHSCPLVLGMGDGIRIYTRLDQIVEDPDKEDLSTINSMFKPKKLNQMKTLEEAERKGHDSSQETASPYKKPKAKDKDSNCSIF